MQSECGVKTVGGVTNHAHHDARTDGRVGVNSPTVKVAGHKNVMYIEF